MIIDKTYSLYNNGTKFIVKSNDLSFTIKDGIKIPVLCFTSVDEVSTISLSNTSSNRPIIYYSLNSKLPTEKWSLWGYSQIELQPGESVWMYGDNTSGFSTSSSKYSRFIMSGKISASGNIQSLISINIPDTIPSNYCYYNMFRYCTSLVTAPSILPATTLADGCYSSMFYGCSSLVNAPELPATTLADGCYSYMFWGCSSLVEAPSLPATTLVNYCYSYMFYGCSKLNRIEVGFTEWTPSYATNIWLNGVSQTSDGIFIKPFDLPVQRGNAYIPYNWQIQNK